MIDFTVYKDDELESRLIAIESKISELFRKLDATQTILTIDAQKIEDCLWQMNELCNQKSLSNTTFDE